MASATTYVSAPWPEGTTLDTVTAELRRIAADRLQGNDGISVISVSGEAGGTAAATFRREWDDKPAKVKK